VSELRSALDGLAAVDVSALPDADVGWRIEELSAARHRLDGEIQRLVAVFDARGLGQLDGAPSTASWLRGRCRLAPTEASARVKTARTLRELPRVAAALGAGEIGLAHARAIAMLADDVGPDTTRGVEEQLVEVARLLDPVRFAGELRAIREALAKDKAERDEQDAYDRRRFSLARSFDGMSSINGWAHGEGAAIIGAALDPLAKPLRGDTRTHGQRYLDAFVEVCRRSLDHGDLPASHAVRPHLLAVTQATPNPDGGVLLAGGRLTTDGRISSTALARIACDADITPALLGADGHPLNLGRTQRVISPALWKALVLRDGGCVVPEHDCPATWTQGHHLWSWLDGGPTDLWNLALVCTFAHRLIHEGGFALCLNDDNHWVLRRPDGIEIVGLPLGQTHHGGQAAAILNGPRGPCETETA
jgi:hypothetical protein